MNKSRKVAVIFDLAGFQVFASFSLSFDPIGIKMTPFDSSYQDTQEIIFEISKSIRQIANKIEKTVVIFKFVWKILVFWMFFIFNLPKKRFSTKTFAFLGPDDHSALN